MDFLHGSSSEVGNTDLAAALCTLGVERNKELPLQVFEGEINRTAFYFDSVSRCGEYKRHDMCNLWNDQQSSASHPRHAMTYMRAGSRNRSHFLKYSRREARIGLKQLPGKQFEAIYLSGTDGRVFQDLAGKRPAPVDLATTPRLQTDDLELASALSACGVPLWRDLPIERTGERLSFFFMPASPCGQFQTRELMLAWEDLSWHQKHPEHPFAYLQCWFENRRRLMREIRAKAPMATFIRAGLPHFLSSNCDARTETLFTKELKKL